MSRIKKLKDMIKASSKTTSTVYVILRILVIFCMIREIVNGNFQNALLCVLSLILFLMPFLVEKTFKVDLPVILEVMIFAFIFSAEILGEINNFYRTIPFWDSVLHTINGFLAASVGFSLIYLLNENIETFKLSPIFVSIFAFCFSMTIGIIWEFFEYSMDKYFNFDMQKDAYITKINTVELDPKKDNNVVTIDSIKYTIIYDENEKELVKLNGYLDIGLDDTIKDLWVNFIGATVYSIFGYLYIINKDKYHIAGKFLTKRAKY